MLDWTKCLLIGAAAMFIGSGCDDPTPRGMDDASLAGETDIGPSMPDANAGESSVGGQASNGESSIDRGAAPSALADTGGAAVVGGQNAGGHGQADGLAMPTGGRQGVDIAGNHGSDIDTAGGSTNDARGGEQFLAGGDSNALSEGGTRGPPAGGAGRGGAIAGHSAGGQPDSGGQIEQEGNLDVCDGAYLSDAEIRQISDRRWTAEFHLGAASRINGVCSGHGPETVIRWVTPNAGRYLITTANGTTIDTVIAVRPECDRDVQVTACNDNLTSDVRDGFSSLQSAVVVNLEAERPIFIYVDSHDDVVHAPMTLSIIHLAEPQGPTIDEAIAARHDDQIFLRMIGRSTNGRLHSVSVQYMQDDNPIGAPQLRSLLNIYGRLNFDESLVLPSPNETVPTHLLVTVTEDENLQSEIIRVPLEDRIDRSLGQSCDARGIRTRCMDNARCRTENQRTECRPAIRPNLMTGKAWRDGRRVRVEFSGRDADKDLSQIVGIGIVDTGGDFDTVGEYGTGQIDRLEFEDDVFTGRASFFFEPGFYEGIRLAVSDELNLESDTIDIVFERPVRLGLEDECDVEAFVNQCPMDTQCRALGDAAQCRSLIRPIMTAATVRVNGLAGSVGFEFEGLDGDMDVSTFEMTLRNRDGRAVYRIPPRFFRTLSHPTPSTFRAAWSGSSGMALTEVTSAEVSVQDWSGLTSPSFEVATVAPANADADALCDPAAAWTTCGPDHACTPEANGDHRCRPHLRPVIEGGQFYYNTVTQGLGIELSIRAGNSSLAGFELDVLDDQGESVLHAVDAQRLNLPFDSLLAENGVETGRFQATLETIRDLAGGEITASTPTAISIRAITAGGQVSESLERPLSRPPGLGDAESCDLIGGFGQCEDGWKCVALDEAAMPVCWEITTECRPDWPLAHEFGPDADTWVVQGRIDELEDEYGVTCGLDAPTRIARFTAPTADIYVFSVEPVDDVRSLPFPSLSLRTHCIDLDTEFECISDIDSVHIATYLEAEQTTYVVISAQPDIFDLGSGVGQYRLRIERHTPPVITHSTVWLNPALGTFDITLEGIFDRFTPVASTMRLLDVAEQPIPLDGLEDEVRLGGRFNVETDDQGSRTFSGRVTSRLPDEWAISQEMLMDVDHVELTVLDDVNIASNTIRVIPNRAVEVANGELCDAMSARSFCADDSICIPEPTLEISPLRCYPIIETCPEAWTVHDLNAQPLNEGWIYDGQLAREIPPLEYHGRPTCGARATGYNDAFEFTAPVQGLYRFETFGPVVDTIIWARSACALPSAEYELACNDDALSADRPELSQIDVRLDVNERIYVFVDSYDVDGRDAYRLGVERISD